jgi:hypothetical protein
MMSELTRLSLGMLSHFICRSTTGTHPIKAVAALAAANLSGGGCEGAGPLRRRIQRRGWIDWRLSDDFVGLLLHPANGQHTLDLVVNPGGFDE